MLWFIIAHLLTTLLIWLSIGRRSNQEKDLEIPVLRQQVVPAGTGDNSGWTEKGEIRRIPRQQSRL
jgi:hypothetical protein